MKKFISACVATLLLTGGLALTSAPAFADDIGDPGYGAEQSGELVDQATEPAEPAAEPAEQATGPAEQAGDPAAQAGEPAEQAEQSDPTEPAATARSSAPSAETYGTHYPPSKPEKPKPEKPEAVVTYGEWEKTDVDCTAGVETYTRTVSTQDWKWSDHKKKWVKGEVTETTETKECPVKPGQCIPDKPEAVVTYGEWEKTDVDCTAGVETYTRTVTTQDWKWSDHKKKWVKGEVTETTETKECPVEPGQCIPDKPEPVVTTGEWEVTEVDCIAKTQTLTRTVTTQDWKWSDHKKKWVKGEVTETTETEVKTATAEQCPIIEVVPIVPSVTAATAVCNDGAPLRTGGTITLPAIENASWEGGLSGTLTEVDPGEHTFRLLADEGYVIADANGFVDGVITVVVADAETPDCTVPTTPTDPGGTVVPPAPQPVAASAPSKLAHTGGSTSLWLLPAAGLALLAGLGAMVSARVSRR